MWPFKPKQHTQLKIQLLGKPPTKLRLDELRADPEMAKAASELLHNPMFQIMMQVCRNESPAMIALMTDVSMETRALHQARIEGYNMYHRNLEAMADHVPLARQLAATFEEEEKNV